ncbi:hypothetical protein GCM10009737_02680 [Nocardioides lentus]|uniref:Uncharacterized protein n=1 Tax=Nocardioides lentus TaxID=338077 RepID=A0ABN2NWC1_9ACTN
MRLTEGLPDEAGLRRITRRAALVGSVAAGVCLLLAGLVVAGRASASIVHTPVLMVWMAAVSVALNLGPDAGPQDFRRREVVLAGSPERRRRIRRAVVGGRSDAMTPVEQRIVVDWARIARVRTHVHLLGGGLLAGATVFLGLITCFRDPPAWVIWTLAGLSVLGIVLTAVLWRESRAVRRFLAEHEG